jgi:hypothetical protein
LEGGEHDRQNPTATWLTHSVTDPAEAVRRRRPSTLMAAVGPKS